MSSHIRQDMRPQDSLPFLRRISTEYRRAPLVPSFSPAEAVVESPLPLEPPVPPFAAKEEPCGRPSFDSGYSGSDKRGLVSALVSRPRSCSTIDLDFADSHPNLQQ